MPFRSAGRPEKQARNQGAVTSLRVKSFNGRECQGRQEIVHMMGKAPGRPLLQRINLRGRLRVAHRRHPVTSGCTGEGAKAALSVRYFGHLSVDSGKGGYVLLTVVSDQGGYCTTVFRPLRIGDRAIQRFAQ